MAFRSGASGTVRSCTILGSSNYAIGIHAAGTIIIEDNYISAGQNAVAFDVSAGYGGTVYLRNNILESQYLVLRFHFGGFTLVSEANHFLLSGPAGWYAQAGASYGGPPIHFNLSGCWWGTTDTDFIAQRIIDGNSNPQLSMFFDFLPIADQPVPVQSQTWTEVKNLFRE